MKSYFEEFDKKYNRPRMDEITVGFSGIDPPPKLSFIESIGGEDGGESIPITIDAGEISFDSGVIP